MKEFVAQLDKWLRTHRVDFYAELNPPITTTQLAELEKAAGTEIPSDFESLLTWKNGQSSSCVATFHPSTNEMFMSSTSMIRDMKMMNELLEFGDISVWESTWAPFMDNGGGDLTCIDLKSGEIISRDHETEETIKTHDNIVEWIEDLVRVLSTKNFKEWDFDECQGAS